MHRSQPQAEARRSTQPGPRMLTTPKTGLVPLLLALAPVSASLFNYHETLGMACAISARDLFTTCDQEDYGCFCNSTPFVYAVEKCIARESKYNSTTMGISFDMFNESFCKRHNSVANTTEVWSAENQRKDPTVSHKAFQLAYDGEKNNAAQKSTSVWQGVGLVLYWVVVVVAVTLVRLAKRLVIRLFTPRAVMRRSSATERLLQKYLLWPALFNSNHMVRYEYFKGYLTFSLPTRFESAVVSVYIVLVIIFMCTPYTIMNNDPLYQSQWKQRMRYASDRAGIIATIQFPLLVLFALRNNIMIALSGWSFSTFNAYHRAIARITYILLVIHAVLKHIFSASYGGSLSKYYYPVPYFRWGCSAIGLFSLMIALASFRNRLYEFFYRSHQAMAIGGFICSIFHLNGIGFKQPLWICFALWGADWIVRGCRILLFNVKLISPPIPGSQGTTFATARIYQSRLVQLSITTPVRWVCEPGQYVFLHTSRWSLIGGHPFSVVGASDTGSGLELVLKAREGVTRKLYTQLDDRSCSPEYPATIPVYVEGPYGHAVRVQSYDEGLFFAGGIGITGVLGYMEKMREQSKHEPLPKTIRLFWSVRSRADIEPFAARLARLMNEEGVQIRIFMGRNTAHVMAELDDSALTNFTQSPLSIAKQSSSKHTLVDFELQEETEPKFEFEEIDIHDEPTHTRDQRRSSFYESMSLPSNSPEHTRRFSVASAVHFVKARDPNEDESGSDDYGKAEVKQRPRSAYLDDDARVIVDEERHKQIQLQRQLRRNMRKDMAGFVEAGFRDDITDREIPTLNPFDDNAYRIDDYIDCFFLPSFKTNLATEPVYELIAPTGMDIPALVSHHLRLSDGSVCVMGCGPDRMMDTLCWACCEFLDLAKNGRVDYFEEAFRW